MGDDEMLPLDQTEVFVSLAVIVERDEAKLDAFVDEVSALLETEFAYREVILLDNGTRDGTHEHLNAIRDRVPNVRILRLASRSEWSVALRAALESSVGDYVVSMDIHRDPVHLLAEYVDRAAGGVDLVKAEPERPRRPGLLDRVSAWGLKRAAGRFLNTTIALEHATFMVFTRRAANAFTRIRDRRLDPRYFNVLVGLPEVRLTFPAPGKNKHRDPWEKPFWASRLMANLIVVNSASPLRIVSLLGLVTSLAIVGYMGYIVAVGVLKNEVAEGWITTSMLISGLFFVLFVMLTVLSEYITRILSESQDRPLYFIVEESHSRQTMGGGNGNGTLNVVHHSEPTEPE